MSDHDDGSCHSEDEMDELESQSYDKGYSDGYKEGINETKEEVANGGDYCDKECELITENKKLKELLEELEDEYRHKVFPDEDEELLARIHEITRQALNGKCEGAEVEE